MCVHVCEDVCTLVKFLVICFEVLRLICNRPGETAFVFADINILA